MTRFRLAALRGADIDVLLALDPRDQPEDLVRALPRLPQDVMRIESFFEHWYRRRGQAE